MFQELKILFSDNPDKARILPAKSKSKLRWVILVLSCLMLVGSYYCFDIPAALKSQIDDYFGNSSDYETNFSFLYSLYAFPNVILPFFGGYFVDKFGVRLCMLVFAALITFGQVIVCIGIMIKSWPVLFLGRFVFGLGGESLTVAISALLADWFQGKELAFAFGLNLSIARLGSVVNNILSPELTLTSSLLFAMWFGAITCVFSVLTVAMAMPIDKAFDDLDDETDKLNSRGEDEDNNVRESLLKNDEKNDESNNKGSNDLEASNDTKEKKVENEAKFSDLLSLGYIFWVLVLLCAVVYGCVLPFNNIASSLLLERDYFIENPSDCKLEMDGCQSSSNEPLSSCPTNKYYQPPLPYNVNISDTFYSQVTPDDVDCTSSVWSAKDACTFEFCDRLAAGQKEAALIMSIPYIISSVLSPIVGISVDLYGMRAVIATIAPLALIPVHIALAYSRVNPVGPLVGQGLAYTGFASVLWPAIPLVVEERFTGLAFGIATAFLNLACAVFPIIIAAIFDSANEKYIPKVEELFIWLAVIGSVVGLYLNYYDYRYLDSVLNRGLKSVKKDDSSGGNESGDIKDITSVVTLSADGSKITYNSIHSPNGDRSKSRSVNSDNSSVDFFDIGVKKGEGGNVAKGGGESVSNIAKSPEDPSSVSLDAGGWKSHYEADRRAMSSNVESSSLQGLRSENRNLSVDNLSSRNSVGDMFSSSLRSRRKQGDRSRGSSFTSYEQIHRGGGI